MRFFSDFLPEPLYRFRTKTLVCLSYGLTEALKKVFVGIGKGQGGFCGVRGQGLMRVHHKWKRLGESVLTVRGQICKLLSR